MLSMRIMEQLLEKNTFALNNKNVLPIVEKIVATKPDVILNNIEGESNLLFFDELRKQGITPEKIPTMSFSIANQNYNYLVVIQ